MQRKQIFTVLPSDTREPLWRFVAARLALDDAAARELVVGGAVYLDGKRAGAAATPLRAGSRVIVHQPPSGAAPSSPGGPLTVYCDAQLVVVSKPAGLPTFPGRAGGPCLAAQLVAAFGAQTKPHHRLDASVSGLLVAARTPGARAALVSAQQAGQVRRQYLALVCGEPVAAEFAIDTPLSFDGFRAHPSSAPGARSAHTQVTALRSCSAGCTLVALRLGTGRTHQLRAHLASVGLPILGDERYGGAPAERVALHAYRLTLPHPDDRRWIDLHDPWPTELRVLEQRCGR